MTTPEGDSVNLGHATLRGHTDKAIHVFVDDLGEAIWVPHSQTHVDSEVYYNGPHSIGDEGDLVVTRWFAQQRGYA